MSRYVPRAIPPRLWSDDHDGPTTQRPTMTVHEADPAPEPTGLLDAAGVPLYRVRETVRMGFGT